MSDKWDDGDTGGALLLFGLFILVCAAGFEWGLAMAFWVAGVLCLVLGLVCLTQWAKKEARKERNKGPLH